MTDLALFPSEEIVTLFLSGTIDTHLQFLEWCTKNGIVLYRHRISFPLDERVGAVAEYNPDYHRLDLDAVRARYEVTFAANERKHAVRKAWYAMDPNDDNVALMMLKWS